MFISMMVVLLTVLITSVLGGYGNIWTQTSAPQANWMSIASDSTGQYLAACQYDAQGNAEYIYTSSSGGSTWSLTLSPTAIWTSIVSNSTGKFLAATGSGYIYSSSSSGGSTWTLTSAPYGDWRSIASDHTGEYLAAVQDNGGGIYTSSSGGRNWTKTSAPGSNWNSIASDSTGQYLVAVQYNSGYIYTSSSGGSNWTKTSAPFGSWYAIASNSTGQYLAATQWGGSIYTSSSGGSTWTQTLAPNGNWKSITSDSTGKYLAAIQYQDASGGLGNVYTSTSGGSTWTMTSAPSATWWSVVSNSEGSLLVAGQSSGIYLSIEHLPSSQPSSQPSLQPSSQPSSQPSQPSSSPSSFPTLKAINISPFEREGWSRRVVNQKILYFFTSYLIYFIVMYALFYIAGLEIISKRLSSAATLLQSSFQSGIHLPISLLVSGRLDDSIRPPVYIEMLRKLHYDRFYRSGEKKSSDSMECLKLYPLEFYIFLSQNWTNLGCNGLFYPNGFHIPVVNKTLKVGVIENMYLYTLNHHDFLKPFLCAKSQFITRGDNRNLFITTYAVAFFVSTFLDILLRDYFNISKSLVVLIIFIIVGGISYISKKIAIFFFSYIIDIQRHYRLKLQDTALESNVTLWIGYILSLVVLFGCMLFCSTLLVFACLFSVRNDYSRESIIIHNALLVHLSLAIQKVIAIMLLYVDRFHINISISGHNLITIGAFFCESLVRDNKEYYHSQRLFCNSVVVDYVVTMKYANMKGWVIHEDTNVNPMISGSNDKVAKRILDTEGINMIEINRISMVTQVTESYQNRKT